MGAWHVLKILNVWPLRGLCTCHALLRGPEASPVQGENRISGREPPGGLVRTDSQIVYVPKRSKEIILMMQAPHF